MTLHLVEPTGYSGIFQHTVALAEALASTGETVVFHTAAEHEELPAVGFTYCPCCTWPQRSPAGTRQRIRLGARYLDAMFQHVARQLGPSDIVHLQGSLAGALSLAAVSRCGAPARASSSRHTRPSRGAAPWMGSSSRRPCDGPTRR